MQAEPVQAPAPKGLKTAGVVAVVAAIGVVAAGAMVRRGDTQTAQAWSDARSVPTVHLVAAKGASASDALTLPGTMQAWNAAKLYARVGGYVSAWYKDIGASVGAGTPLGRIDTPELDQQIASARAALVSAQAHASLARSTAARWNDLLTDNSVSKQEADEKNGDLAVRTAAVQAARADLGRLLAQKAFSTVRAPFAGTVTSRNADIGDLVGPGASVQQPMFSVADTRKIRIYVNVPQNYSAGMTPGLTATLTTPDYPARTFNAHVIGNSGAINQQTGTFQVQLIADNADGALKPGGYAQVKFDVRGQTGTVQIPSSALIFRAQGTQVATVGADRHIHLRPVTIGRDLGPSVEITSGLSAAQKIVDNPPDSLADGELVRVEDKTHG
ncbi:efflux RND transporter periplasmic adaptor subunit [Sphingomonas sp. NFR15]|uniref:efflux RND transporter periplasmic adaptor subunit n=1 Tax=Sphingomonas sp. NFR15 TaxID=1566282 RepID=UPI00088E1A94|nr:efflux RND transporter periplasmic adaptor subunit [Sphingomonas sp. NFR15]SDA36716.1 RND family efflux transporter, MFP subunit [Sphingomonas sp. NFR15]